MYVLTEIAKICTKHGWHTGNITAFIESRLDERANLRAAGAVLLRAIYESGMPHGDPEIAEALAVFAEQAPSASK